MARPSISAVGESILSVLKTGTDQKGGIRYNLVEDQKEVRVCFVDMLVRCQFRSLNLGRPCVPGSKT